MLPIRFKVLSGKWLNETNQTSNDFDYCSCNQQLISQNAKTCLRKDNSSSDESCPRIDFPKLRTHSTHPNFPSNAAEPVLT